MNDTDFAKLVNDLRQEMRRPVTIGVLGLTAVVPQLVQVLAAERPDCPMVGIFTDRLRPSDDLPVTANVPVLPLEHLATSALDVVVVASDEHKEDLLLGALPHISGAPKVLVAGYGHLAFRDEVFQAELTALRVPSLANGYPNSLIHLYQCVVNAARLGLDGVVAEFGMFKGGTTMFLSRVVERLGMSWPVIGFDTFGGFPPRRSPLDMYDHPDCIFTDLGAVQRYLTGRNVEIVVGDIIDTADGACSTTTGTSTFTGPASSTVSADGPPTANATAPDLRPVLVLRCGASGRLRASCRGGTAAVDG